MSAPDVELSQVSTLRFDRLRREHVAAARAEGASWGEVGQALGVSEDAVLEYYFADARRDLAENAGANDGDLSDEQAMELAVAEVRAVRRGANTT